MIPPKIQRQEYASEIMRQSCPYTRRTLPPYLCLVDLEGGQELCRSEGLSVGLPSTREASGDLISQHPQSQSDE